MGSMDLRKANMFGSYLYACGDNHNFNLYPLFVDISDLSVWVAVVGSNPIQIYILH